ncbi:MAG: prolipoprotein diacylglyceryl transferase family protein [Pseudolysinimonas sp.]
MLPLTSPSPPLDWSVLYFGSWIHSLIPAWPAAWTLPIHLYALFILTGIIVALIVTNRRLTTRGGEPWIIIDVIIPTIIFGLVGARAWHVVTHIGDYFGPGKNTWNPFLPGAVWNIWDGGGAILGTLLLGAVGVYVGCRVTGLRFTSVIDAIAPTLLLAQALGRLGNYFNNELYGLPTDLPWGLQISSDNAAYPAGLPTSGVYFHPTFLYEIIWNLAGFVIILLIQYKVGMITSADGRRSFTASARPQWQWGKVLGLYLIWYGLGRTWLENIRIDPSQTFLGIRDNVWGALGAIALGVIIIAVQTRRHPGTEPSVYRPGKEWSPPAEVDSEDIYSDTDDSGDDAAVPSGRSGSSKKDDLATSGAVHS